MSNLVSMAKNFQMELKKAFSIPFSYAVFAIACVRFFFFNNLNLVSVNKFVPVSIQKMILQVFDFLYSQNTFWWICWILVGVITLLCLLTYTPTYNYVPDDIKYTNGTTVSWNYISAIKRTIRRLWNYLTIYWLWYFIISVFFNQNGFIRDFWSTNANGIMISLFFMNLIILFCQIVRAMFIIKLESSLVDESYIKMDNLNDYTCLALTKQKDLSVAIFKTKSLKKPEYLLVSKQGIILSMIPDGDSPNGQRFEKNNPVIQIHNVSDNLEDIKLQFDSIRKGDMTISDQGMAAEFFDF